MEARKELFAAKEICIDWGSDVILINDQKYNSELFDTMERNRYAHGDYAKGYYKTLISAASYFALNEEAYNIF